MYTSIRICTHAMCACHVCMRVRTRSFFRVSRVGLYAKWAHGQPVQTIHMHTHTHTHTHMRIHMHMYAQTQTHTQTHTLMHMHMCSARRRPMEEPVEWTEITAR